MFILENVKHIRKHIENTSSKIVQYISFRLFLCNKNNYHLFFKWNLTHIFTEKQWETQQRGAIPCPRWRCDDAWELVGKHRRSSGTPTARERSANWSMIRWCQQWRWGAGSLHDLYFHFVTETHQTWSLNVGWAGE